MQWGDDRHYYWIDVNKQLHHQTVSKEAREVFLEKFHAEFVDRPLYIRYGKNRWDWLPCKGTWLRKLRPGHLPPQIAMVDLLLE